MKSATPKARTDDGLLDLCLMHDLGPLRILRLLAGVWRPGFTERADVIYAQGTKICLEPAEDRPVPLQVDGDPAGWIPARFGIIPKGVRMVTPAGAPEG